ncbi:protein tyrosine phosphatase family protein [Polymorphobacter sp.]|uniref:protein tyrosine phosphatase family protein n=1 Tax=Polymorphobacter sp. TaxID=1909290 RepID=UPI003F7120EA
MTDPVDIHAWRRLDARLTTSGQPTEPQLADLKALGVETVINLGLHSHERALPDEAASLGALGIAYIHIPVPFDAPDDNHFTRFCAAMADTAGQTVHVHCILNMRVSAFLYRYRRDVLGMDEAEARAAMTGIWQPDGVWADFIR